MAFTIMKPIIVWLVLAEPKRVKKVREEPVPLMNISPEDMNKIDDELIKKLQNSDVDIPTLLLDLLEGCIMLAMEEKPKDSLEFAAWYFCNVNQKKKNLENHGAAGLGQDFFVAANWSGAI